MPTYPGEFEQAVLLAVMRLGDEAYGRAIRKEIEEQTGRTVTHGAAYITLDRLEAKGLLSSRMADPDPDRGGRRKRFFRVTAAGMETLRVSRQALLSLWSGFEDLLEES
jgi:DNA-binding PadR family transcriptional regulator